MLGWVPLVRPFPSVAAPMRSYDSPLPFGFDSGSPRLQPTSLRASRSSPASRVHPLTRRRRRFWSGSPLAATYEEASGPPRLLGRPLRTCHDRPPRRPRRPLLPICRRRPCCLQALRYLGLMPELPLSLAVCHGPHVRPTTHQRLRYRRRCKSSYRPAGRSFGRAGFAPAGRLFQNFKAASSTSYSFQTSIAWSHPKAEIQVATVMDCRLRGNDKGFSNFREVVLDSNEFSFKWLSCC